jgi:predicted nucleic acid-binding protein
MAATAIVRDFVFVTRNTAHVTGVGARLLNPWDS